MDHVRQRFRLPPSQGSSESSPQSTESRKQCSRTENAPSIRQPLNLPVKRRVANQCLACLRPVFGVGRGIPCAAATWEDNVAATPTERSWRLAVQKPQRPRRGRATMENSRCKTQDPSFRKSLQEKQQLTILYHGVEPCGFLCSIMKSTEVEAEHRKKCGKCGIKGSIASLYVCSPLFQRQIRTPSTHRAR